MMGSFVSGLKEFYYRVNYRFSEKVVRYELHDVNVRFHTVTYAEFRRFQSLMGEDAVMKDLLQNLEPSDVFFDVGANVGTYSCFAAEKLDSGQVIAFEPEPTNANRLRENESLNDQEIELHRLALSDARGDVPLELDEPAVGAGQHSLAHERSSRTIEIVQEVGDRLVNRGDVPVPTVLKIDVEGAEMKVLNGLMETLDRDSCRLVYCEVHPDRLREFGHPVDQLYDLLRDRGFTVHILKQMGDKFFVKAEKEHVQ